MKSLLFFLLTTIFGLNVFATAQYSDKIVYKGKEFNLNSNPLESYFDKYPAKRPKDGVMSTALWRGYVATFEIRDNQLFLKDIEIKLRDTINKADNNFIWKSVISEVFPDQKNIKIDWFTGLLILPHGEIVNYVHMGYGSTYEQYTLMEVDQGDLKKEKQFNNKEYDEFKERQFQFFKKTDKYKQIKTDLQKDGSSDDFIDSFLKDFVIDYTTKILTE